MTDSPAHRPHPLPCSPASPSPVTPSTADGLVAVAKRSRGLVRLAADNCNTLSPGHVVAMLEACPALRHVSARGCPLLCPTNDAGPASGRSDSGATAAAAPGGGAAAGAAAGLAGPMDGAEHVAPPAASTGMDLGLAAALAVRPRLLLELGGM
jgi:hypothetical protein